MNRKLYQMSKIAPLLLAVLITACTEEGPDENEGDGTSDGGVIINPDEVNSPYSLSIPNSTVDLTEGSDVAVTVRIQRNNGYAGEVTVGAEGQSDGDAAELELNFSSTRVASGENSTILNIKANYSALPIQPQTRTLVVRGTDGTTQANSIININLQPTDLPDVYLLVGQSNMVGFSELGAKQAGTAGDDAPVDGIRQLNVTGNDQENFRSEASFRSVDAIAVPSPRFTQALDPLHDGFDFSIPGKERTLIGPGLSFAKQAKANTNAREIFLVPAAWADTGFCRRDRDLFEGSLGWNATTTLNTELSGTLLHDRAIARANLTLQTLQESGGGILRGILWHQGEADSDSMGCAQIYQQKLVEMVASFRTNIIQDARGPTARGENANVPFVVATMSKGGVYSVLSEPKLIVDSVHRNIAQIVPFSAFVNNDDLIPPDYPCGEGDCIHFGSKAYREMGFRYYQELLKAAIGQ